MAMKSGRFVAELCESTAAMNLSPAEKRDKQEDVCGRGGDPVANDEQNRESPSAKVEADEHRQASDGRENEHSKRNLRQPDKAAVNPDVRENSQSHDGQHAMRERQPSRRQRRATQPNPGEHHPAESGDSKNDDRRLHDRLRSFSRGSFVLHRGPHQPQYCN